MAKVSIIIPTRNRAHLLYYALRSALKQTFEDYEVVVCDNFSVDETKKVVDDHSNPKIFYVRTAKPLPMHDNWEYALRHASGEYVTLLTDDSYLLPNALKTVMTEIHRTPAKVAVWRHCAYFAPDWMEAGRRNLLHIPKTTFQSYLLDGRSSLERFYNHPGSTLVPKALNSLCHRSVVEKVMNIQGRFFLPSSPDYTAAASTLLNVHNLLFIDQPLFIDGVTTASIGAAGRQSGGKSAQAFWKEFDREPDQVAFLGMRSNSAGVVTSLENVRKFYPDTCPPLNWPKLLQMIGDDLMRLRANGVEVYESLEIYRRHIASQAWPIRVAAARQKVLSLLKWKLIRGIRSSPRLESIETIRNIDVVRGEDAGFTNIEESCTTVVQRLRKAQDSGSKGEEAIAAP